MQQPKFAFALLYALLVHCGFSAQAHGLSDVPLRSQANLERFIRVTQSPFLMQDSASLSCKIVAPAKDNPHEPLYPKEAYCHVYVNRLANDTIKSGKGKYPVGSIIIKSKLAAANSKEAELYTVMQKMTAGYDKDHGDWKYSVLDGKTFRSLASGRIESCIDCHTSYSDTDFVTRTYMKDVAVGDVAPSRQNRRELDNPR